MKSLKWFATIAVLLAIFGSAQLLVAQGTDLGTITGVVTDSTGAVVPNAKVVILDLATNTSRETVTNGQGMYRLFGLSSGKYQVKVSNPGMATVQIVVDVRGSDVVTANAQLKVAATSETVSVLAEAPIINTENQTISNTIPARAVVDLPRDSRNVYSFLYLNPNITQGAYDDNESFKFLGAQSYGASFSLDGQRTNGGIFGAPTESQPSLEAVSDVNVLSNNFSAEYPGIANIRVTSKRGGTGYHGTAFYNNSNSALAAWTLQDQIGKADFTPSPIQSAYPNPYFNVNDLGGSIGGPVPKLKKTFFFAAYERNWNWNSVRVESKGSANVNSLPDPNTWVGDFSRVDDSFKPHVPATVVLTPTEIANNTVGGLGQQFITIPSRLLSPYTQRLIQTYFPVIGLSAPIEPNGRVSDFQTLMPGQSVQDRGTLRVDKDFSDKDHVYVTYNASAQTSANQLVQAPYTGLGLKQRARRNNTVEVSYTRAFSASVVNEARAGFNHQQLLTRSNTTLESFLSSIGFDQAAIDAYGAVAGVDVLATHGHPAIGFNNRFVTFKDGGRDTDRPTDQNLLTFGDTFTWILGKHALKMGADFVRNAAIDGFAWNRNSPRGVINYSGSGTDPFASFLMGLGANTVTYINAQRPAMDVYNWEQGFFFQDDWKVSPRLTLNLGLRYELVTPFIENNDVLANFDSAYVDPSTGQKGRFIIPSEKTLPYLDTRIIDNPNFGLVTAAQSGLGIGRGLVRMDKNNFAPRIGAAFQLTAKSVLRGGYGLYYPTSAAQGIRDAIATNPFNQKLTKRNANAPTPLQPWPDPLTGGIVYRGNGGLPSMNAIPVGLQQPRIQQYNVTFERELARDTSVRVSYLGTTMSGLIAGVDLNAIPPSNVPFGTTIGDGVTPCDPIDAGDCDYSPADLARQPFPGLGDWLMSYGNFGHGRSNAFQAQFEHRYSHGFMLNAAYTYNDQRSTALDTGNSSLGGVAYNPFQPNHDYGQEAYLSKSRFIAYGTYDLPFGRGRKFGSSISHWADAFLGGWQTTMNMFAKTGTGFTPYWICNNCGPIAPGNIGIGSMDAVGDFNNTSLRPTVIGNPNRRNGNQIWDPSAFGVPSTGAGVFDDSNVAKRNMLMGPGTWGVNLGVHKEFHAGERMTFSLGMDIDNLFNHPLFSPDADYGGGGGAFALLGDFNMAVDPATLQPVIQDVNTNDDFGRLIKTFTQEGVDSRRTVRLRLRITF